MTLLDDDRPTLLLFGDGEPMIEALVVGLRARAYVSVETKADSAVPAVLANVPDLTVFVGQATDPERAAVLLRELREHPLTASSPVALLAADDSLAARLRASEHGVVTIVPRVASPDAMARQMVELASRLYDDPAVHEAGDLTEASVDDLVQILGRELQSGILSVTQVDGQRAERFVVRAGQPMRAAIRQFIERVRPLIADAKPLQYAFHEAPLAPLFELDDADLRSEGTARAALRDRRFLLIANNPAHADALAQELRACDALVVVVSADGSGWDRAHDLDPEVALIDEEGLNHWGFDAVAKLRSDPQLRWAVLVVMDTNELLPSQGPPRIERLAANIARLSDTDGALRERAALREDFVARIETVGPTRVLRALLSSGHAWNLSARPHGGASVTLALAEGLVAGASARLSDGRTLEGAAALACLLVAGAGRLHATPAEHPALANMLMPLDEAVRAAHAEGSPVPLTHSASTPPPPLTERVSRPSTGSRKRVPAASTETEALVGELESLVDDLSGALSGSPSRPPASPSQAVARAIPPTAPPPPRMRAAPLAPLTSLAPPAPPARVVPPLPRAPGAHAPPPAPRGLTKPLPPPPSHVSTRAASSLPPPPPSSAATRAAKSLPLPPPPPPSSATTRAAKSLPPPPPPIPKTRPAPPLPLTVRGAAAALDAAAPTAAPAPLVMPPAAKPSGPATAAFTPPVRPAPAPVATSEALRPPSAEPAAESPPAQPTRAAQPAAASAAGSRVRLLHIAVALCVVIAGLAGFAVVFALATRGEDAAGAEASQAETTSARPPVAEPSAPGAPTVQAGAAPTPSPPAATPPPLAPDVARPSGAPEPAIAAAAAEPPTPTAPRLPSVDPGPMPDEQAGAAATVERYRAALSRGSRARSRGDLAEALSAYGFALLLKPRSTDAALGMARTYLEAQQGADALRWAERARDLEPRSVEGQLLMGDALLVLGEHARAVQVWEAAQTLAPSDHAARERIRHVEEALSAE